MLQKEDIPFIFSASRYQGFNDGLLWDAPEDEAELINTYKDKVVMAWQERHSYSFAICNKSNNELLGSINIKRDIDNIWTIGFWLHPKQQGKGYMTESVKGILELGFTILGASRIDGYYAIWNTKSQRVLERVGMQFLEYIPQGFIKKGQWVEQNRLGITKQQWSAL